MHLDRRQFSFGLGASIAVPGIVRASPAPDISVVPELAAIMSAKEMPGTFAALKNGRIYASDTARVNKGFVPASTFKIPNSLIALDLGVVADPDRDIFKWDGVKRSIENWNRDHTLRSAMAVSALPAYQQIARSIGAARMQAYINRFDYGNRDIGGGIDKFWLSGAMRISAMQQIAFVDSLQRRALDVSRRSQDLVADIMPVTNTEFGTIHAKTGLAGTGKGGAKGEHWLGWLVGWLSMGDRKPVTVFALNVDLKNFDQHGMRMVLAIRCLAALKDV